MFAANAESKMPLDLETLRNGGNFVAGNGDAVSPTSDSSTVPLEFRNGGETKIYKKRYFILIMFIFLSASNAMQWIEYSIIAHIITHYYNVSYSDVDWTSMIYMLSYMILVFPGR